MKIKFLTDNSFSFEKIRRYKKRKKERIIYFMFIFLLFAKRIL